jgi:hypothetical protein
MRRWLVRLFAHDVARKVLAFFFALVLFDVLDKKVQADDRLAVKIEYVDEPELDRKPESPDDPNRLLIAERGGARPLVVSTRPRPESITLFLHGTKDTIERAKSRRHRFVLRLQKEGVLSPAANDLEGIDALLEELGPGARVDLERVQWEVEPEETRKITLDRDDLVLRGTPAPGYDRGRHEVVFQPSEIQLIGPKRALEAASRPEARARLFSPIQVDGHKELTRPMGLHPVAAAALRMETLGGADLAEINVTVKFQRGMADIPEGSFSLSVNVLCDHDALRIANPNRSLLDGWRLVFAKGRDGVLKLPLKLRGPDANVTGQTLDRAKITLAKQQVALVVRAEAAATANERTTLPVDIVQLPDFPPDLEVVFEDGSKRQDVEVVWTPPAKPVDASKEDADHESGTNGGH